MIDKLLELQSQTSSTPEVVAPMTPQKKLDFCLPVVNTPGSSAFIKSLVQSARKTGLNCSPVRIPFALSPMAIKLQEKKINFSPVKGNYSKEPSQPIKEAFMTSEDTEGSEAVCDKLDDDDDDVKDYVQDIQLELKRPLELAEEVNEESDHVDKKQKIQQDFNHPLDEDDYLAKPAEYSYVNDVVEDNELTIADNRESNFSSFTSNNILADFESNNNDIKEFSPNTSSSVDSSHLTSSSTIFPPSNFSIDLLKNLKDPELASPELFSVIDSRPSRGLYQDDCNTLTNNSLVNNMNSRSTISKSASDSSSSSKSSNNPLLPSGILKLLEKKRQEKEQQKQQQQQTAATSTTTELNGNKKKFDLKESLKRALPYKPHIGTVKPKKDF